MMGSPMRPMTVNGIVITPETILATREWYAANARACINGATTGKFRVNDLAEFVEWHGQMALDYLRGDNDGALAFMQRALYMQTGVSVAILS